MFCARFYRHEHCSTDRYFGSIGKQYLSENSSAHGRSLCCASPLKGAVEVDESDFGARRVRGKRGRGPTRGQCAYGKTIVFGLLKRQGPTRGQCKVYTKIVQTALKPRCKALSGGHVPPATLIHSDGWRGYDGLVDIDFDKHFRVNHGENEFANGERHINGIESFWSYAKRRLAKFNGILSNPL